MGQSAGRRRHHCPLAFVTIDNPTMYEVYIVKASADVAEKVEFQQPGAPAGKDNALTEMPVPAFGGLELKPDGAHLTLVNLTRPLNVGDTVTLTLVTDGGVTLSVQAQVR